MNLYLCGPMSGRPYFNQDVFDAAYIRLRFHGHKPVSPVELDRDEGLDFNLYPAGTEALPEGFTLQSMIRRDLDAIDGCEGVVLLPGWEHSKGAAVEIAYAKFTNKTIYDYEEFR